MDNSLRLAGSTNEARQNRHHVRREEIIDVSAALFAKVGYQGTSVQDLCNAVGLGKGGFYHYIGSKEDLLVEIHGRVMTPLLQESKDIENNGLDPVLRLRLLSESLLTVILERLDHVWVFLHEYRSLEGDRRDQFRSLRREYEAIIERCLRDGINSGTFRIEDTRVARRAFLGMHNYTYQWVQPGGADTAQSLSRAYCRIFLGGILVSPIDLDGLEVDAMDAKRKTKWPPR